ncbi:MAG TPA: YraN family protein [Bacteroidales bacterium]|jgi:putative endonuclease|nr:YraN family protein [Bacteroidales bacterium]
MAKHNELGKDAEMMAIAYLAKAGYKILETNWRFEKKEIDIIAEEKNQIVIVEVKCRSTDFFGKPEEAVTPSKQKFLTEAANQYMQELDHEAEVRFDILSVLLNDKKAEINHIEDAFRPIAE